MNKRGSILITIIFLILIFFMGISLLNFTLLHNRITGSRNIHRSRSEQLHNRLIFHLHYDSETIRSIRPDPEDDPLSYLNAESFPSVKERLAEIRRSFRFNTVCFDGYTITRGRFFIDSVAEGGYHKWSGESSFKIISGNIPLNFFPVLDLSAPVFSQQNKIPDEKPESPAGHYRPGKDSKPVFDVARHIASLFNTSPVELSLRSVMDHFGLSGTADEFTEGIYWLSAAGGFGPVFVQGDTDRIILSVRNHHQSVEIDQGDGFLRTEYDKNSGYLKDNSGTRAYDPPGIHTIIINGDLNSLESGTDPALFPGCEPVIIVLGNLTLTTSLEAGHDPDGDQALTRGITIICAGSPFREHHSLPVVTIENPGTFRFTGSLNIMGLLINKCPEINLRGNLSFLEIQNPGRLTAERIPGFHGLFPGHYYLGNSALLTDYRIERIVESFDEEN